MPSLVAMGETTVKPTKLVRTGHPSHEFLVYCRCIGLLLTFFFLSLIFLYTNCQPLEAVLVDGMSYRKYDYLSSPPWRSPYILQYLSSY